MGRTVIPLFDFAISFSGIDRAVAEEIAEHLSSCGAKVFFDTYYRSNLLGRRLDRTFESTFGRDTQFFVPLVSSAYVDGVWPQYEWGVGRREADQRAYEFILPLRLDDSPLLGLPDTIGYIDLRQMSLRNAAICLLEKLTTSGLPEVQQPTDSRMIVCFGMMMESLDLESIPKDVDRTYAYLCDWLIDELRQQLEQSHGYGFQVVEDSRDSESLSVRLCFSWKPDSGALDLRSPRCWDLLELLPYEEVYTE